MDPTRSSLAFLLSLGALPLACNGDDTGGPGETTGSAGATEAGTTGGETESSATTEEATTTAGTTTGEATTTSSSTDATSSSTATTSSTTTTSAGETETEGTGTTGPIHEFCGDYASAYALCQPREEYDLAYPTALGNCELGALLFQTYGEACTDAFETYIGCLTGLSCQDLPNKTGCEAQAMTLQEACVLEVSEICETYGAKSLECTGELKGGEYCQGGLNFYNSMYGAACGAAAEDFFACLSDLDCADFETYAGCEEEIAEIEALCM